MSDNELMRDAIKVEGNMLPTGYALLVTKGLGEYQMPEPVIDFILKVVREHYERKAPPMLLTLEQQVSQLRKILCSDNDLIQNLQQRLTALESAPKVADVVEVLDEIISIVHNDGAYVGEAEAKLNALKAKVGGM